MAIKKQEFYEGAALHLLARAGKISSLLYEAPFFYFNGHLTVLLKYSTRVRGPWGFTFNPDEQLRLQTAASKSRTVIVACTRFRRHRVRCFNGTGGWSWSDGSLRESSSLRRCA